MKLTRSAFVARLAGGGRFTVRLQVCDIMIYSVWC